MLCTEVHRVSGPYNMGTQFIQFKTFVLVFVFLVYTSFIRFQPIQTKERGELYLSNFSKVIGLGSLARFSFWFILFVYLDCQYQFYKIGFVSILYFSFSAFYIQFFFFLSIRISIRNQVRIGQNRRFYSTQVMVKISLIVIYYT